MLNPGLVLTDMVADVEAIEGYSQRMSPLNTVLRMWGNPAEVPARKAVWLASSETDGKTGLEVNILNSGLFISGALREGWRRLTHQPPSLEDIKVSSIPPAFPSAAGQEPAKRKAEVSRD